MSRMTVTVAGDRTVEQILDRVAAATSLEPTPGLSIGLLDEVTAVLLNRIRRRFLDTTAPDGTKWLKSRAAIRRAKTGRGGDTLFDTGRLFHSIQLASAGPNFRMIGTNVPYGPTHQLGLGKNPKREFLGFSDDDNAVVLQVVVKRIKDALK